jgi:hypothetical protein
MRKISVGDDVIVARDITRREGIYATAGETGRVVETFRPPSSAAHQLGPWYAKVRMAGGVLKTFRVTSLERDAQEKP